MWEVVRSLRASGVTIILTTHYIEEAEEMADRVGVIAKGELILVEDKDELMRKLGKKQLVLNLNHELVEVPAAAQGARARARRRTGASSSSPTTRVRGARGSRRCSRTSSEAGITFTDLNTTQSSLEDIFVDLVRNSK